MYAGSKYESHYEVWTAWISIRVRVRVGVYFILQNLAPPGTTVHVPTAHVARSLPPSIFYRLTSLVGRKGLTHNLERIMRYKKAGVRMQEAPT